MSQQVYYNKKEKAKTLRLEKYVVGIHKIMKLKHPVEVRIAHLRKEAGLGKVYGYAWDSGRHLELDIRYRFDTVLKTLCHEMVHCQQYQTKKLITANGVDIWEGKLWEPERKYKSTFKMYLNQPWEVEARSMEKPLYQILKKV